MVTSTRALARIGGLALLAAALAACGGATDDARAPGRIEGLETWVVADPVSDEGRAWDGVVEAVQQATLTAQTAGRVAEVAHDVDDHVTAGTVLVRLSAVEQQAEVDTARAQLHAGEAAAREAEADYQRYVELSQRQYVSRSQLERMHAARDAAVAARDAARARLASASQTVDYTVVRAPYDGIVASRDVEPGESVAMGQRLVSVFAPTALRIEVELPQGAADQVRADPRARVRLHDQRVIEADDVIAFPAADAATHTVRVRVLLPALDPAPIPGSTAKVRFPAVASHSQPRIPASAIVRRGEVTAAYVLADGRLSLRQLRLGEAMPSGVDVLAGLQPGETIALDPVAARQALVAARGGD